MDFYQNSEHLNNDPHLYSNGADKFALASVICGILSLPASTTGILAIPLAALGILFAVLSRRKGKALPTKCIIGILTSCIGMVLGIVFTVHSFYMVFNDPVLYRQFNSVFESMYGMDFMEYMSSLSGKGL